ncbi:hypothetical protein H2248_001156 [Termitomyces sp. 'cryptogamus']|nr:hypothetical protein H2248_001156 [Termitomyces sp. 'cryptogamus']
MTASTSNTSGAGLGLDFLSHRIEAVVDSSQDSSYPYPYHGEESNFTPVILGTATLQPTSPSILSGLEPRKCPFDYSNSTTALVNDSKVLTRHGTLLSANTSFRRNVAELSSIMGDSTSRLKLGAMVLPLEGQSHQQKTSLEQAKTRARVEVDIILNSYTYVQGGYLQGHVRIKIRECARNEVPVMISGGKVRVVGFESISSRLDKYPFYQCSSPLETVIVTSSEYYDSYKDPEGFAQAIEGEHTLPFSMYLPMSADYGVPKGSVQTQAGVAVRYIAIVSIKVKDPISNGRSIAHFYRSCEIWPRLDPSIILAPTWKPLQAKSVVDSDSRLPGYHRTHLTASVDRLHWVAGQQCFVKVSVANESKKTVKSIALALVRTTVLFKPSQRAANNPEGDRDEEYYDACSTSTTHKIVAESVLEMCRRSAPRHASAKGWWTGVAPGEHLDFSHSILLPPDALSVIRSLLLQVDYSVRVTLSAGGTLRTTELQVSLPIQIINFISIDPLPNLPSSNVVPRDFTAQNLNSSNVLTPATLRKRRAQTDEILRIERLPAENPEIGALRPFVEEHEERLPTAILGCGNKPYTAAHDLDVAPKDTFIDISDNYAGDTAANVQHDTNLPEGLDCFTVYEDDADEIVPRILQDDPQFENAPRFADLYYVSVQDPKLSSVLQPREERINYASTCPSQYQANLVRKVREYMILRSGLHPNSTLSTQWRSNFPKGPSSFASRVRAKLAAAAEAGSLGCSHVFPVSEGSASSSSTVTNPSRRECIAGLSLGNQHHPCQLYSHVSDGTPSRGPLACSDRHTTLAVLSTSDSTSSLPYTRDSTFTNGNGTKLSLSPESPVVVNIESVGCTMDELASIGCSLYNSAFDATQPTTCLLQLETDITPKGSSQHREQHKEEPEIDDNRLEPNHTLEVYTRVLPRPSLLTFREQQAESIFNGSTNSVKERIRELEERQRLLQVNGADGVRSFV